METEARNSGFGRGKLDVLIPSSPLGKTFVVGAITLANYNAAQQLIGYDKNGKNRLYATLAGALAACTANAEDVIFVLPGHTETFSSSTALSIATAGVKIVGLGRGSLRPTFTLDTATTTTINVTAANIGIKGCIFVANFAAIASLFTLTAAPEFTLESCEYRDTSSILNFVAIITTDTTSQHAAGLTIVGCRRIGAGATTNTTIVSMLGTNDRVTIGNIGPSQDNYWAHSAVTPGGLMIIATGKIVTNATIRKNVCNFVGATGITDGMLITTNGTTNSGIVAENFDQNLDATTEILVTASSGFIFFNNYHAGVPDKSGYLLPAADA